MPSLRETGGLQVQASPSLRKQTGVQIWPVPREPSWPPATYVRIPPWEGVRCLRAWPLRQGLAPCAPRWHGPIRFPPRSIPAAWAKNPLARRWNLGSSAWGGLASSDSLSPTHLWWHHPRQAKLRAPPRRSLVCRTQSQPLFLTWGFRWQGY